MVSSLFVLLLPALLDAETALKWKLKEGQSIEQLMDTKSTTTMPSMNVKTSQTMAMNTVWNVKKIGPDGKADIVQKTENLRCKMEMPQATLEYDSKAGKKFAEPMGSMLNPIFDALLQGETKFQMTPEGKFENIQFPEKMMAALKGGPTGGALSEDTFKQMLESFPAFPAEGMAVGKKWDHELKVNMPFGTMNVASTIVYKGPEKKEGQDLEAIDIKSSVTFTKSEGSPVDMKLKSFNSTGKAYFDNQLGRYNEMVQSQKMVLEISGGGMAAMETISETETKVKFSDRKAEPKKE
jgi:hypothetical protein